ncbi:Adiponectin receptor protein-like [Oopsacas minuta]|uniref:Adiponectin receptor protein-like n=1 Tax=Oopsacas minuta TaxID=111878 RepID=A0AAV7JDL7_9METZ|nr:Adiponectin receptor protein-like [Oopsacas minuta]
MDCSFTSRRALNPELHLDTNKIPSINIHRNHSIPHSIDIPLVSYKELPDHMTWLTDNPFLRNYYRKPTNSFLTCVSSNFSHLHTESLNILTHLIPTLLAVYAILHLLLYKQPLSILSHSIEWEYTSSMDRLVLCLVLVGILSCMGLSTLYHTFSCHEVYGGHFLSADLVGIVLFGYSITQATEYFIFYLHSNIFICSVISNLFFTVICIFLIKTDTFSRPENKWHRCGLFFFYGVFIFTPPLFCLTLRLGVQIDLFTYFMYCFANLIAIGGAVLYSFKFPESYAPGVYDIWGQSHTTMHVTSAISAFFLYQAILQTAEFAIQL